MKTFKVTKTVVSEQDYEVIAKDEKQAEEAVYWRDSSGRETTDATKLGEKRSKVEYRVEPGNAKVCECGHLMIHHNEQGCGWSNCVYGETKCPLINYQEVSHES